MKNTKSSNTAVPLKCSDIKSDRMRKFADEIHAFYSNSIIVAIGVVSSIMANAKTSGVDYFTYAESYNFIPENNPNHMNLLLRSLQSSGWLEFRPEDSMYHIVGMHEPKKKLSAKSSNENCTQPLTYELVGEASGISLYEKPKTDVALIRETYCRLYRSAIGASQVPWGAKESARAKNILSTYPMSSIIPMLEIYFSAKFQNVVRDGYPFCEGYNSFCSMVRSLYADLHKPQRRIEAGHLEGKIRAISKYNAAKDIDKRNEGI